jgi:hypothetical protein
LAAVRRKRHPVLERNIGHRKNRAGLLQVSEAEVVEQRPSAPAPFDAAADHKRDQSGFSCTCGSRPTTPSISFSVSFSAA